MRAPDRRQQICAAPRWCAVAGRRSSSWPGAVRSRAGRRRPGPAGSRCSGAGRRRCRRAWCPGWPLADCLQALLCLQLRDTHQPTFTAVPKATITYSPAPTPLQRCPAPGRCAHSGGGFRKAWRLQLLDLAAAEERETQTRDCCGA